MSQTHFIQKENIQIVFTTQSVAEEHWESLLDFHKNEGQRVIEDVFNVVAAEDEWVRIDSLSIDLGKISSQNFRQHYLDLLRSRLGIALASSIANGKNLAPVDSRLVWEDIIIHYLTFGTILWTPAMQNSTSNNVGLSEKQILEQKIAELIGSSASFRNAFAECIRKSNSAMHRWIRQFSSVFLEEVQELLLQQLLTSSKPFIEKSCNLIDVVQSIQLSNSPMANETHQSSKWNILFSDSVHAAITVFENWVVEHLSDKSIKQAVVLILEKGADADKIAMIECLTNHPQVFNYSAEHSTAIRSALDQLIKKSSIGFGDKSKDPDVIDQNEEIGVTDRNEVMDVIKNAQQVFHTKEPLNKTGLSGDKKRPASKSEAEEENEIYVDNAGLVLLAPFLQHFFEENGIDITNNLEDDEDASRCIHLLQYLVTNNWEENEDRLPLNKILCGRSFAWAPFQIGMPDAATTTCAELLQSVIHHWSALKNTSIEGLQETFLQREGKLTFRKEQWELFINYKTPDILLQSIPWTFSVIKLPWMKHPLFVNW